MISEAIRAEQPHLPVMDGAGRFGCPFSAFSSEAAPAGATARIIVGDRIKAQCQDDRILSITEAERLLGKRADGAPPLIFHAGQGIEYDRLKRLYEYAGSGAAGIEIHPRQLPLRASQAATHKHVASNIAISEPAACGDGSYGASLLLDDRCADVSDHLTGQHIPGMAVAEAARQMMIAVVERFFLPAHRQAETRFITHEMALEYHDFMMPLPIDIHFLPLTLRRVGQQNLKLSCEIRFTQHKRLGAQARLTVSVIDRGYLESREHARLRTALDTVLAA